MSERIDKIKEFLKLTPDDDFLKHALALEYIKIDNTKEARKLFEEILINNPDYVGSYYHLAKLLERNNEIKLATEWYEKGMAAAKKAGDNRAYNELHAAYEELIY